MKYRFANAVSELQPSAIREILKFTSLPGVISFAAGNPAPDAFPSAFIAAVSREIFEQNPVAALQYSITEGYPPLREALKRFLSAKNCFSAQNGDDLIVTSGAQQVMELSCKVLCGAGETLICEEPSFIGSLNAFKSHNVNLVGVELDDDGINLEKLERELKTQPNVKLIYLIPNFQNPTGRCTSYRRRKEVYSLAEKYDVIIIEDDPYGELRWSGENIPSVKSFDTDGRVIYAGSFSKILSPGLRVGYVSANEEIIKKITVCKQVSDVHTNIWAQLICHKFMTEFDLNEHFANLRAVYKRKCELMLGKMDACFSKEITYTKPVGGLFLWATLPDNADMAAFCKEAVERHKIAVVPGSAFLVDETDKTNSFRLNFSTPTDENIVKGIEILGIMTKKVFS